MPQYRVSVFTVPGHLKIDKPAETSSAGFGKGNAPVSGLASAGQPDASKAKRHELQGSWFGYFRYD